MKPRVLVTGGTGFIGSALVKRMVELGYRVRSFDNDSRGSAVRLGKYLKDVECVLGDIRDSSAVIEAARDCEMLVHLAYINGTEFFYSKPDFVLDVAVRGMVNVLDACEKNKIKNFVLASSSEVYQSPPRIPTDETVPLIVPDILNPRYSYGGGKILCELMTINYGRKRFDRAVIFRPHNVYGPDMGREHVIPQFALRAASRMKEISTGRLPFEIQGDGKQTRAFIFIDDFTDGLVRVIENGKHLEIYHIGTRAEISMADLAQKVVKFVGREIDLKTSPAPEGGTLRRVPDISKLERLGYQSKISIDEGLSKTIPWYLEHPN